MKVFFVSRNGVDALMSRGFLGSSAIYKVTRARILYTRRRRKNTWPRFPGLQVVFGTSPALLYVAAHGGEALLLVFRILSGMFAHSRLGSTLKNMCTLRVQAIYINLDPCALISEPNGRRSHEVPASSS